MSTEPFCRECICTGQPVAFQNPNTKETVEWQEEHWPCPLLGGNICRTCCEVELAGGMGAPDTLRETVKKTGKTVTQIHAVCLACPHGGPGLEEAPTLVSAKDENGKQVTSGPVFEAVDREFKEAWDAKLGSLKKGPKDWWPGERG